MHVRFRDVPRDFHGPTESAELTFSIPFRGSMSWLIETLQSLLRQTSPNWIAIVADNSEFGIDADSHIEFQDPRIRICRSSGNLSSSQNGLVAFNNIATRWGVLLGADDLMSPDFVEVFESLKNTFEDVAAIVPHFSTIDENGMPKQYLRDRINRIFYGNGEFRHFSQFYMLVTLSQSNWLYFTGIVFNMTKLNAACSMRIGFDNTNDLHFCFDLLLQNQQFTFVKRLRYFYRRSLQSISLNPSLAISRAKEETILFLNIRKGLQLTEFSTFRQIIIQIFIVLRLGYRLRTIYDAFKAKSHKKQLLKIALSL